MRVTFNRRQLFAGAALLAAGVWARTGLAAAHPDPRRLSLDGWTHSPSLSDDFRGPARSARIWHQGLWYPRSGAGVFRPDHVTFAPGMLQLRATPAENNGFHYGAVESHVDLPGVSSYVEGRPRVRDSRANVLSAIWLQSSNRDGVDQLLRGANPNPEIDVLETFTFSQINSATHIWPDNRGDLHVAFGGVNADTGIADISRDFHTYGIERRDGLLRCWFDRQLAWELPAPDPSLTRMSRHQVLSLEGHLGRPFVLHVPGHDDETSAGSVRRWHVLSAGDGAWTIRSKFSGLALAVGADGQLVQAAPDGTAAQRWRFVR